MLGVRMDVTIPGGSLRKYILLFKLQSKKIYIDQTWTKNLSFQTRNVVSKILYIYSKDILYLDN
jgi:hypothetical protein